MLHTGSCHCRAVRVTFETSKPLAPRACQCSFCRKHGARTVTDPQGSATLAFARDPLLYRFATGGADYVICATCGIYMGAVVAVEGARRATLNLNAFDDPRPDLAASAVCYDGESAAARAARRAVRWTPLTLVGPAG